MLIYDHSYIREGNCMLGQKIREKYAQARKDIKPIQMNKTAKIKTSRGEVFEYEYCDRDHMISHIKEPLEKQNLGVRFFRKPLNETSIELHTVLEDYDSGESIEDIVIVPIFDDEKKMSSYCKTMQRQALDNLFCFTYISQLKDKKNNYTPKKENVIDVVAEVPKKAVAQKELKALINQSQDSSLADLFAKHCARLSASQRGWLERELAQFDEKDRAHTLCRAIENVGHGVEITTPSLLPIIEEIKNMNDINKSRKNEKPIF